VNEDLNDEDLKERIARYTQTVFDEEDLFREPLTFLKNIRMNVLVQTGKGDLHRVIVMMVI